MIARRHKPISVLLRQITDLSLEMALAQRRKATFDSLFFPRLTKATTKAVTEGSLLAVLSTRICDKSQEPQQAAELKWNPTGRKLSSRNSLQVM